MHFTFSSFCRAFACLGLAFGMGATLPALGAETSSAPPSDPVVSSTSAQNPASTAPANPSTSERSAPGAEEQDPKGEDLSGKGKFVRMYETISPDGAFVVGWGKSGQGSREVEEIPRQTQSFTRDQLDWSAEDYLVDARKGEVLARFPDMQFYEGLGRHHLEVAWSMDSLRGVVMDRARWANGHSAEAVVYFDPRQRKFYSILPKMDAALARYAARHLKKAAGEKYAYFDPVMLDANTLSMQVTQGLVIGGSKFDYRVAFAIGVRHGRTTVRVESAQHNPEEDLDTDSYTPYEGMGDEELRAVWRKLRAKLSSRELRIFTETQARWLRYRAKIKNYFNTDEFTRKRVLELRLLLAAHHGKTRRE